MHKGRSAFTLIEVMVAVMIVSVVIAAIYKMQGDRHNMFFQLQERVDNNHNLSLLLWNQKYGFEDEKTDLYKLSDEFEVDDDLRRKLKSSKVEVLYDTIEQVDMSEYEEGSSTSVFEIGKSSLKLGSYSSALFRLRLQ